MKLTLQDLTKDLEKVDVREILSCWKWYLGDMKAVVLVSCLGDMFLLGKDNAVYWLQTDSGNLDKVAQNLQQFERLLTNEVHIDNWFLPALVEQLIKAGMTLKEAEVYSYKKLPVIGGEYSVDNIEVTDMNTHFSFTGQICEQIKDLPDGTKVSIKIHYRLPECSLEEAI